MNSTHLMIFLLFTLSSLSCSSGWSVAGWEITPSDTNTVFIEITDTDLVKHYYYDKLYPRQNWCWLHSQFEDVKRIEN